MSNSDSATNMLSGRNGVTKDVHIYTCTCDMDLRKEIHIQSPKLCNGSVYTYCQEKITRFKNDIYMLSKIGNMTVNDFNCLFLYLVFR